MIRVLMPVLAVLLLAGCAGMSQKSPEEQLKLRAEARWEALIGRDWEAAYAYLSPGYRSGFSAKDYIHRMQNRTVSWLGAEVFAVECEETADACKVRTRLAFKVPAIAPGVPGSFESQQVIIENWIQSKGKWYYVPKLNTGMGLF